MTEPPPTTTPRSSARFGVSGWDYRDWRGPVYPSRPAKSFRPLRLLSRFLDFMEVNSTFYHPMGGAVSERWLSETPSEFTFVLKAWQGWTHQRKPIPGEPLEQFRQVMDPMIAADRLEGVLVQYPPAIRDTPDTRGQVVDLLAALAPARVFVEVRHRSLYHGDFFEFLRDRGADFVNVDLPEARSLPPSSVVNTGRCSFVRLHGRNRAGWLNSRASRDQRYDYRYTIDEISSIVDTVRQLLARTPRVLVAANNHFAGHAPAAVVLARAALEERRVPAPAALIASHPELEPYCEPLVEDGVSPPGIHP